MTTNADYDPWVTKTAVGLQTVETFFDDQFCPEKKDQGSLPSGIEYSKKLEQKLCNLQKQRNEKSGKVMLRNLEENKEFLMNELLTNVDIDNETISVDSQTFLDKLYNTNSLYRHLNPQQALDNVEKVPIVQHDQLAINNERNEEDGKKL